MKNSFPKAFDILMKLEGGYVNDPDDPGGETKYGISKKAYPGIDITALTQEAAMSIYRVDYWQKASCDIIPVPIDVIHFDCAVNCGVKKANMLLQQSISAVVSGGIEIDGIIGKNTIDKLLSLSPDKNIELEYQYMFNRLRYYYLLQNAHLYFKGWAGRLIKLKDYILTVTRD